MENTNETVETTEQASEQVTTEEVTTEKVDVTQEGTEVITDKDIDLGAVLDEIFKDLQTETKKVGPNITTINKSEAETMLSELKTQLDNKEKVIEEANSARDELLTELDTLKTQTETYKEEIQTYKNDIESMEKFFATLSSVPVLGELVNMVLDKGPEAVNIPKYLKELHESKIMAQNVSPNTEVAPPQDNKPKISSLEQAILKRNKR